jgi:hypothetical protein
MRLTKTRLGSSGDLFARKKESMSEQNMPWSFESKVTEPKQDNIISPIILERMHGKPTENGYVP